jgi:SRSO17 transposase
VYLSEFQNYFRNKTKSNFDKATQYVEGLALSDLKNIERITETLNADYHKMQHFITESNWDARAVIDQIANQVDQSLPKQKLKGLLIDESGWVKKGDKSIGVDHQYCGNVGKTANSQVAVFGCLCTDKYAALVDTRLYLPKSWCNNSAKCETAGIPEQDRVFKTKPELATDIVKHQLEMGIEFDYVGGDGLYGNDLAFTRSIEDMGLVYMLDIHSDQKIHLEKPELYVPQRKSNRGRTPKRLKASTPSVNANEYIKTLTNKDWKKLDIRDSAKGKLKGSFHFKTVYIWDKTSDAVEKRLLVISKRKTKQGVEIKYSFTNAELAQYTHQALAYMQAQRFFIEHSFKEQKQIIGMDQFQTRKWLSWHHQVALNMLVGSFMLKEKLLNQDEVPLLSARDIMDFMVYKFYREMTDEMMLEKLQQRHKKRQRDIDCCYSKQ